MNNREKVIKGLKYLHDVKRWSTDESEESITARRNITGDALALLKAQEPVEPIMRRLVFEYDTFSEAENKMYCPKCKMELLTRVNYCPKCGQAVKWE